MSAFVVRCLDSRIPLVSISEISSHYLASVAAQAGLCLTWSQTPKTGFLVTGLVWFIHQRLRVKTFENNILFFRRGGNFTPVTSRDGSCYRYVVFLKGISICVRSYRGKKAEGKKTRTFDVHFILSVV